MTTARSVKPLKPATLLPQIAADFNTTVGAAAMVVTAYAIAHGSIQLVIGPVGDRFGKYRTVALMCAIGAVLVACCGLAGSLSQLMLARLATGAAAGWVTYPARFSASSRARLPAAYSAT